MLLARLFVKLVLEAPCVTPTALEIIKGYCREEVSGRMNWSLYYHDTM